MPQGVSVWHGACTSVLYARSPFSPVPLRRYRRRDSALDPGAPSAPGARLGEGELASLFNVSRTLVREALMRLASRHIVEVRSRRGWFVVEPSSTEAKRVFERAAPWKPA